MTQPSEQSIRKACEEAGVKYVEDWRDWWAPRMQDLVLALARRIEAEREVVAWMYEKKGIRAFPPNRQPWNVERGWIETPLYAAPPKEPMT